MRSMQASWHSWPEVNTSKRSIIRWVTGEDSENLLCYIDDTVKSQTRIKNKLKAKFRQNGIKCSGETVYSVKYREEWKKLPQKHDTSNGRRVMAPA